MYQYYYWKIPKAFVWNTIRSTKLSQFQWICTKGTEKFSSIITCSLVSGETTCPQSCSLATAVVLSPIYTAVTWQWVFMSECHPTISRLTKHELCSRCIIKKLMNLIDVRFEVFTAAKILRSGSAIRYTFKSWSGCSTVSAGRAI
jgi:hypothetical protein